MDQVNALINVLQLQRNEALDKYVHVMSQSIVFQSKIEKLELELEELKVEYKVQPKENKEIKKDK